MDNAKEYHSEEMVAFCRDNGTVIQPVVTHNHTVMYRVESYIGVVKSHGRVGILNDNVPLCFHGDTVLDFCIKWNFTWYSQKGLIGKTTVHDLIQPVFDSTRKNVCIPFGSRIISPIPCDHNLVRGSSFDDRFVEGIYLHKALAGPVIHIFDMHHKQEIVVKNFTSYPSEFPFKDPSCLTQSAQMVYQHRWCTSVSTDGVPSLLKLVDVPLPDIVQTCSTENMQSLLNNFSCFN